MNKRILLVEDDENLGFVTKDSLENKGYQVSLCENGESGLKHYQSFEFDVCILDVMLPKMDGFSLAKAIRKIDKRIPILFLTAKGLQEDKLVGFQLGGDDYITKPFSIDELIYRIEVFLKRATKTERNQSQYTIGSYNLDLNSLTLKSPTSSQKLTRRETEILQYLIERKGTLVKRENILLAIWGDDDYFKGRSLDVFISKLRKYLKDDAYVDIENYHGVGFKLIDK